MSRTETITSASTGSTRTLEERFRPLNAILQQTDADNEADFAKRDAVADEVLEVIEPDLLEKYFTEKSTQDPLNLTLGVEIEGGLLQDRQATSTCSDITSTWIDNSRPGVTAAQQAVHYALSQGLTKKCTSCNQDHTYKLPLNVLAGETQGHSATLFDYTKWTVGVDSSVNAETMRAEFEDEIEDPKKEPDVSKQFRFHSFEIRSRVLGDSKNFTADITADCDQPPTITYQDEIHGAYHLLKEAFLNSARDAGHRAWRLMVNDSMDLHVHIGNDTQRLSLQTVKNIVALYTANERQIDNMHARDRITGSTLMRDPNMNSVDADGKGDSDGNDNYRHQDRSLTIDSREKNPYNRPWSAHYAFMSYANRANDKQYFLLQKSQRRRRPYPNIRFKGDPALKAAALSANAKAWLEVVRKAQRIDHLFDLQAGTEHTSNISLENMAPSELRVGENEVEVRPKKNTVEFRQASATLDSNAVIAWIDVLVKLVNYSYNNSCTQVLQDCEASWQDIRHGTLEFLVSIGLDPSSKTFQHYRHVGPWVSPKDTYGRTLLASEMALARSFGVQDSMFKFMRANSRNICGELDIKAVRDRIQDKFIKLCYGQFPDQFVQTVGRPEDWPIVRTEHQKRLTIGQWECEVTKVRSKELPDCDRKKKNGDDDDHEYGPDDDSEDEDSDDQEPTGNMNPKDDEEPKDDSGDSPKDSASETSDDYPLNPDSGSDDATQAETSEVVDGDTKEQKIAAPSTDAEDFSFAPPSKKKKSKKSKKAAPSTADAPSSLTPVPTSSSSALAARPRKGKSIWLGIGLKLAKIPSAERSD